jgi:hypothetical protein
MDNYASLIYLLAMLSTPQCTPHSWMSTECFLVFHEVSVGVLNLETPSYDAGVQAWAAC